MGSYRTPPTCRVRTCALEYSYSIAAYVRSTELLSPTLTCATFACLLIFFLSCSPVLSTSSSLSSLRRRAFFPVGVLVSLLSPSLPHRCATCSDLRIPISHICTLFLPLSGISEYFSGLVYAFFARTRLYTQNRLSVSLSFAHLAVLQPLVSVFPLSLFPPPLIILLFLFTSSLLSPLFLPSILFYFFSLYQSLFLPFALFSLLSLSLFHFSTLFIVVPRIFLDLLLCSDRCRVFLQATLFMPVSSRICLTIFFVSRCPSSFFTLLSFSSLCFFSKNYHLPSISQVRLKWIFLRFAYFLLQLLAFHL